MLWPVSATPAEEKARARSVSPGLMTTCLGPVNAYGGFVYGPWVGSSFLSV